MPFAVDLYESERGWGAKIDDTIYFNTIEAADAYRAHFNKDNNEEVVPDWYMVALEPRFVRSIPNGKCAREDVEAEAYVYVI